MLFTEPAFLFVFLPFTLAAYFVAPRGLRNAILIGSSLLFYALGEWRFLPFLVASIALNYVLAIWIERTRHGPRARIVLAIGVISDLSLLIVFKYAGWLIANADHVLSLFGASTIRVPSILLPLGISFFTFHKISYKIDVYRGITPAQRNLLTLALYILFFPQLIAGPIIRYHDVSDQLDRREVAASGFARGVRRFAIGMAKKMIVANTVAVIADAVFQLPTSDLGCSVAWLGVASYTLQIYFDFSGYSDMAIGLAAMFGFQFLENFEHPYASRSITEFWRRWHISLSRWFRDYLYIPLGGNRLGNGRTYANLLLVFFLCGLWHGASWAFVAWGLFHGTFLVLERLARSQALWATPRPVAHVYTLVVVMFGWVFFRADSFDQALAFVRTMIGLGAGGVSRPADLVDSWQLTILIVGAVTAFPIARRIPEAPVLRVAATLGMFAMFFLSLVLVAAGTYNPFLYFRF